LGLVGHPGAILGAVLQAATGRLKSDKRQARQQWMRKLAEAEAAATEKLMPLFKSNNVPIHPYRVAWELNEFLADNTVYIGDGGDVVTINSLDRKSTRLNSSHLVISYAVFCLKKKKNTPKDYPKIYTNKYTTVSQCTC